MTVVHIMTRGVVARVTLNTTRNPIGVIILVLVITVFRFTGIIIICTHVTEAIRITTTKLVALLHHIITIVVSAATAAALSFPPAAMGRIATLLFLLLLLLLLLFVAAAVETALHHLMRQQWHSLRLSQRWTTLRILFTELTLVVAKVHIVRLVEHGRWTVVLVHVEVRVFGLLLLLLFFEALLLVHKRSIGLRLVTILYHR